MRRGAEVALAALLTTACTIITDFSSDRLLEQTEERCSDRLDNDDNGLTDCADPSCKRFDFCSEGSEARCNDGVDNDVDGLTDCGDPECCSFAACIGEPACGERSQAACTDGRDNDANGLTDCADFSCEISECCRRLVPLLTESFLAAAPGCEPPDCQKREEDCCSAQQVPCNAFDPSRWLAWGNPAPRITSPHAFTPNQPCVACPASGVVSLQDFALGPDLTLELDADVHLDGGALLSAGFVDQAIIPGSSAPCAGLLSPYPLLAGVNLRGSLVEAVVAGTIRGTSTADTGRSHQLRVQVSRTGSLSFALDGKVFHQSTTKIAQAAGRVRLLLQGHTAVGTIDNVLVAMQNGCPASGDWVAGPGGAAAVLGPRPDRFDSSALTGPSLLQSGPTLRLFYTGWSTTQGSRLGLATSLDGGITWMRSGSELSVAGEDAAQLSDPVVIEREGRLLMAYTRRTGQAPPAIALATSEGDQWTREKIALEPEDPSSWDGLEASAPALLWFRNQLHLYYVGRGKGSAPPSLGLATAGNDLVFTREPAPVLRPGVGTHDDRGIADPWVMPLADGTLQLWYVGLTWGGQTQINLAASEDGRNWVRFPANPALRAGQAGLFGGAEVRGPTLVDRWGTLHLFYAGSDPGVPLSIGSALSNPRPR